MKHIHNLQELFSEKLKMLRAAEQSINREMPSLMQKVLDPRLKDILARYKDECADRLFRIDRIFDELDETYTIAESRVMNSVIKEAKREIEGCTDQFTMEAALMCSIQNINHYKTAAYGSLQAFAEALDKPLIARLLKKTIDEEKLCDKQITGLAVSVTNIKAAKAEI